MHNTLTSTARLGVSVMVDLARRSVNGPVALSTISTRQGISVSYLQQIVAHLRRHALVRAVRGPGGGYLLGRAADKISMADIIKAVASTEAAERSRCTPHRAGEGGYGGEPDMWACLRARLFECLAGISLSDLVGECQTEPLPADADELQHPATAEKSIRRGISNKPVLVSIRPTSLNSVFALGATAFK